MERKDIDALFEQILSTGGLSADMMTALKKIKDYLDEREVELAARGESRDETPPEGFDSWSAAYNSAIEDMETWKNNYIDAFMGRKKSEENYEDESVVEESNTFDGLFEKEEK